MAVLAATSSMAAQPIKYHEAVGGIATGMQKGLGSAASKGTGGPADHGGHSSGEPEQGAGRRQVGESQCRQPFLAQHQQGSQQRQNGGQQQTR